MDMRSAASDNQQGSGGLKLKIKFSRSKGFVSDFVNETVSDRKPFSQEDLCSALNEPVPVGDLLSGPQSKHSSSCAVTFNRLKTLSRRSSVRSLPYSGGTRDSNGLALSVDHGTFCQKRARRSASDLKEARPLTCSAKSPLDFSIPEEQINGQSQVSDNDDTEQHLCNDPKTSHADLPGVNYGKVLQDLEFLSSRQDEPDGRGDCCIRRQREQHLTTARMATPVQLHDQSTVENSSVTDEEVSRDDSQLKEESSDGEPMSPFDINCSLGLADDDFTFSSSTHNAAQNQSTVKKETKENPLFPWSVEDPVHSYSVRTECPPNDPNLDPAQDCQSQWQKEKKFLCPTGLKETQYSSSGLHMKTNTVCRDDSSVRRVIIVDCRNRNRRSGSLGNEINNNSPASQFGDSTSLFSGRHNHPPGTLHIPQNIAFVSSDSASGSSVNLPHLVAESPSSSPHPLNLCTHETDTDFNIEKVKNGDLAGSGKTAIGSKTPQIIAHRTLSADAVSDSQQSFSLVRALLSSSAPSGMTRLLSSDTPVKSCAESAVDSRTDSRSVVSLPSEHIHRKEYDHEQIKNDLLVKLLARKDKAPNTLRSACSPATNSTLSSGASLECLLQTAENPLPSTNPSSASLTHTQPVESVLAPSRPLTSTTPIQLNRTIDELRKRVGENVLPEPTEDSLDNSHESESSSQPSILQKHASPNGAKSKRGSVGQWCRCEEPKSSNVASENTDIHGSHIFEQEHCKNCGRKLSKRWKKLRSKQKRQALPVWCRCRVPDPHVPEGASVGELCRKCMRKVSKKWKRRMASKWCKCLTPILHRFRLQSNQEENTAGQFFPCKRCHKWVSKEKEEFSMNGDLMNPPSLENAFLGMVPQPVRSDHNYSQSPFSPNAELKRTSHFGDPAMCQSGQSENTAEQQALSSKELVYVYPPTNTSNKGCLQFLRRQTCGKSLLNTLGAQIGITDSVPQCSVASVSTSSGQIQKNYFMLSNGFSSPSCASSSTSFGEHLRPASLSVSCTEKTDKTGTFKIAKTKTCKQSMCPSWLQGVSQDLLRPCFVVMEKLKNESSRQDVSGVSILPCSASCRQEALNVSCRLGNLQQCGYSLEYKYTSEDCDTNRLSVWNRKRDYFRRNKTMVGYEEYREKDMEHRQKRQQAPVTDTQIMNNTSSPGFITLSSSCPNGLTKYRISCEDGMTIQKIPENNQLQDVSESASYADSSAVQSKQFTSVFDPSQSAKYAPSSRSSENLRETCTDKRGRDGWSKLSQFSVKYYAFGSGNRAFIVPLIRNKHNKARTVQHLDEEDLGYVKLVINQLLLETDSCARHLKYPDSLQHKKSSRTAPQGADDKKIGNTGKKAFVAPTLGAEDLDIEALKSLISDKDFSRLVPKNSRTSKSKYLQEIGEKVHMYLTGGSEETPDWIKDVAKSIVLKHRTRVKNKKRLKPSKDVSIEIDYAEEEELVDVGEEDMFSSSQASVMDSDSCATGSLHDTEVTNQSDIHHQSHFSGDHVPEPTGSYVVAEAFAQEEKKPLLQNTLETFKQNSVSDPDGSVPEPGQQIMVPLPENCSYGQELCEETVVPSILSPAYGVQQQPDQELSVDGEQEQIDRKPLLGELLAAAHLHGTNVSQARMDSSSQIEAQEQFSGLTSQPPPPPLQPSSWALTHVKEEPPDEDYSHAWPNQLQTSREEHVAGCSTEGSHTIPFIVNSTFGRGAVQIEDEDTCSTSNQDQATHADSSAEMKPVIKAEPFDDEYNRAVGTPVVACIGSGEFAVFANADFIETSTVKETRSPLMSSGDVYDHNHSDIMPQVFSVACGEQLAHSADVNSHNEIAETVEVTSYTDQAVTDPGVSHSDGNSNGRSHEANADTLQLGDLIVRSVEKNFHELVSDENAGTMTLCEQKQAVNGSEPMILPQISAVTFGEAAKVWEMGDDEHLPDSVEMHQPADSILTSSACQPEVLQIVDAVVYGEEGGQKDCEATHLVIHQMEKAGNDQTVSEEFAEEHYEDFLEDDYFEEEEEENFDPEQKPVVADGQVVAVPIMFPSESGNASQTTDEHIGDVPRVQIGIDLSLVKQEPQEAEESVESFENVVPYMNYDQVVPQYKNLLADSQPENTNSVIEDTSPVPSILDVRSLASMRPLSGTRKETHLHSDSLSEASHEVQNVSSISPSEAAWSENQTVDVHCALQNSSQSMTSCAVKSSTMNMSLPEVDKSHHLPQSPHWSQSPTTDFVENVQSSDFCTSDNQLLPSKSICDTAKVSETEVDADILKIAGEKLESLQKVHSVCLAKPTLKTRSKKSRKSSQRKMSEQKKGTKADMPDSTSLLSKTKIPSDSGKSLSTTSVDLVVLSQSLPSNFSTDYVDIFKDDAKKCGNENVATIGEGEIVPESHVTSSISPNNRNMPTKNTDYSNDEVASPSRTEKSSDDYNNLLPATDDFEPASRGTSPSRSAMTLASSLVCKNNTADKDGLNNGITSTAGDAIPTGKGSHTSVSVGPSTDRDALQQSDLDQSMNDRTAAKIDTLPLDQGISDLKDLPLNKSVAQVVTASEMPENETFSGKDLPGSIVKTNKKSLSVVKAEGQNSALCSISANSAKPADISPAKSPRHDIAHNSLHASPHFTSKERTLTEVIVDQGNPVVPCRTDQMESEDSDKCSEKTAVGKKERIVEEISGCSGSFRTKAQKCRKKARCKSRKRGSPSVISAETVTNPLSNCTNTPNYTKTVDNDAQNTAPNTESTATSCASLPQAVSVVLNNSDIVYPKSSEVGESSLVPSDSSENNSVELGRKRKSSLRSARNTVDNRNVSKDHVKCNESASVSTKDGVPSPCSQIDSASSLEMAYPLQGRATKQKDAASCDMNTVNIPEENAHYVAQITKAKDGKGRTCLVLRKTRSGQSSLRSSAADSVSRCNTVGHFKKRQISEDMDAEQLKEKIQIPPKKLKTDTMSSLQLSKLENQTGAERSAVPSLKRKFEGADVAKNDADLKVPKNERSIFSDIMSAMLSDRASSSGPTSSLKSKPLSPQAPEASSNVALQVGKKGFNENLFSRLRASLGPVTESVVKSKYENLESNFSDADEGSGVHSSASSQSTRGRSFFDCLPQGLLDAWKK